LNEAANEAIAATRQLAKRQLTWLRRRDRAQWFDSMNPDGARLMIDALCRGGFQASSGVTPQGVLC
jgi:tRNA dimethylallyltransferase